MVFLRNLYFTDRSAIMKLYFDLWSKEAKMKNLLRLAVAAAATAVIAAVTFVSSVKLAESVEKSLEENDKKEEDPGKEEDFEEESGE